MSCIRVLLFIPIVLAVTSLPPAAYIVNVTQKLDHFSFADTRTFQQRLIISSEHWLGGDHPILVGTGGEANIESIASRNGFIWRAAAHLRALVVFIEHRYYGQSLPFGDRSFNRKLMNYRYLTLEQALQDVVVNVQWIKEKFNASSSRVVAIGGSYGGEIAAWSRMKFPHVIYASLASSAPLLQFPGEYADCNRYYDVVTADYREYSEMCALVIKNSWPAFRRLASSDLQDVHRIFKLCPGQNLTVDAIVDNLRNAIEFMALADYPNEGNLLTPLPPYPIGHFCGHLKNAEATDRGLLSQLAAGLTVYFNYTGSTECNSFSSKRDTFTGFEIQLCSEMVHPYCSNGDSHIFEKQDWNVTEYRAKCIAKHGLSADPQYIVRTFGGRKAVDTIASKIIFSNGLRDPLAPGGILSSPNENISVITMKRACHHEDLNWSGDNDPLELVLAREKELTILHKWLTVH